MNYDENTSGNTEQTEGVTPAETLQQAEGSTDSITSTPSPASRPELQQVLQPELQPVIPQNENGVVQKSLKLPPWLAKALEQEAAAEGTAFNTVVNNALINREKLGSELNRLQTENGQLKQNLLIHQDQLSLLREDNQGLRVELQKNSATSLTLTNKEAALVKVIDEFIKDVAKSSNLAEAALKKHVNDLLNYYLQTPA